MVFLYTSVLAFLVLQNPCGAQMINTVNPRGGSSITLTSLPAPNSYGIYCAGPVNITCTGVKVRSRMYWQATLSDTNNPIVVIYTANLNHKLPYKLSNGLSNEVVFYVTEVRLHPNVTGFYDMAVTLVVKDVTLLNNTSLHCSVNNVTDTLNIKVLAYSAPIPRVSFDSCSLRGSATGIDLFLQWSQSFTTQYGVSEYLVSVNPDLPSCPHNSSTSKDYTCSGLSLGTRYTFTLRTQYHGFRCVNQSLSSKFSVKINEDNVIKEPQDIKYIDGAVSMVQWRQQRPLKSIGPCPALAGEIHYYVEQLDSRGVVVKQEVVSPDACNNSICTALVPAATCLIQVQATSNYGFSNSSSATTAKKRQVANYRPLLLSGLWLLGVAGVLSIILIALIVLTRKVSKVTLTLLIVGFILITMCGVLWIMTVHRVPPKQVCDDHTWNDDQNNLIAYAHALSIFALLAIIVSAVMWGPTSGVSCAADLCVLCSFEMSSQDPSEVKGVRGPASRAVGNKFRSVKMTSRDPSKVRAVKVPASRAVGNRLSLAKMTSRDLRATSLRVPGSIGVGYRSRESSVPLAL